MHGAWGKAIRNKQKQSTWLQVKTNFCCKQINSGRKSHFFCFPLPAQEAEELQVLIGLFFEQGFPEFSLGCEA